MNSTNAHHINLMHHTHYLHKFSFPLSATGVRLSLRRVQKELQVNNTIDCTSSTKMLWLSAHTKWIEIALKFNLIIAMIIITNSISMGDFTKRFQASPTKTDKPK